MFALQLYGLMLSTIITGAVPAVVLMGHSNNSGYAWAWAILSTLAVASNVFFNFPMLWRYA